jgi:hypothetical protein
MTNRIDEIRKRVEAATPGPWLAEHANSGVFTNPKPYFYEDVTLTQENRDFIAHSREDIPYLLNEIHRLQVEVRYPLLLPTKEILDKIVSPANCASTEDHASKALAAYDELKSELELYKRALANRASFMVPALCEMHTHLVKTWLEEASEEIEKEKQS